MKDTLFLAVRLIDPASGLDQLGDLLVRDGVSVIAEEGAVLCQPKDTLSRGHGRSEP